MVESFRSSAAILADMVRNAGAEPSLFMTWAYEERPEMIDTIAREYFETGETVDADVVPVGLAFALVTEAYPEIALRTADAKHPTLAGSYLAACVFFARVEDRSPEGLDYTAGLDPDVVRKLQTAAWQAINRPASP